MIYLTRLAEHRNKRMLTQEELAKLSGVSRPTIAALETGSRRAYLRTAYKLANVLNVEVDQLK